MSLPRDLKVKVPGAGTSKINAAYEIGGPGKTVATIKRLFDDATGEKFPINNVINVNFGGFKRAVNYVGGVYVDVDRRYYNDNTTAAPGEAYATIDVAARLPEAQGPGRARLRPLPPLRQRLLPRLAPAGLPAPDHPPGRGPRAARRRQAQGARARLRPLLRGRRLLRERLEPDRAGPDRALHGREKAPVNEVRFPAYEAENPSLDSYLYVKDSALRKTVRRVHDRQGLVQPAPARRDHQARPPRRPAEAQEQEQQAVLGQGPRAGAHRGREHGRDRRDPGPPRLPVLLPGLRKTGSRYADSKPRIYGIRDARASCTAPTGSCSTPAVQRVLRRPGDELAGTRRSSTTRTARATSTAAS